MGKEICRICGHPMGFGTGKVRYKSAALGRLAAAKAPKAFDNIPICSQCGTKLAYVAAVKSGTTNQTLFQFHEASEFSECVEFVANVFANAEDDELKKALDDFTGAKSISERSALADFYFSEKNLNAILKDFTPLYNNAQKIIKDNWSVWFSQYYGLKDNMIAITPVEYKNPGLQSSFIYPNGVKWLSRDDSNNFFLGVNGSPNDIDKKNNLRDEILNKGTVYANIDYAKEVVNNAKEYCHSVINEYKVEAKIIPLDKIIFFKEIGRVEKTYDISGGEGKGGGINSDGAFVGGLLFGAAGAIIGSQAGTETNIAPIKTTINEKDTRSVLLQYEMSGRTVQFDFPYEYYTYFMRLIPEKEYSAVIAHISQPISINNVQTIDKFEEIKKYKELLDMGIITQEEFDTKKKELI